MTSSSHLTVAGVDLQELVHHAQLAIPSRPAHVLETPPTVVPHTVRLWVQLHVFLYKVQLIGVDLIGSIVVARY